MEPIPIECSKLRQALDEVFRFVATRTKLKKISLKSRLAQDLGLFGDDNLELIEAFVKKYKLSTEGFDYSKHFESETDLFQSPVGMLKVIWNVFAGMLQVLSFNYIKIQSELKSDKLDLTVKEMVLWYLDKDFKSVRGKKNEYENKQ